MNGLDVFSKFSRSGKDLKTIFVLFDLFFRRETMELWLVSSIKAGETIHSYYIDSDIIFYIRI